MKAAELREHSGLFSPVGDELGNWFVLHTKSRQEKAVASDLGALGIGCFLPLVTHTRMYGSRKIRANLPLFPGYVFARGSLDRLYIADRIKRLVNIIPVTGQEQLNWELKNLNIALTKNASLDPYKMLKVGARVEVRAGPFRGLQGLIESRDQPDRLILQVQTLGRAVSLEIDAGLLDVI